MPIKLTKSQVFLIGAATQRDDRFIALPEGRGSSAARKAAESLLTAGLAREVRARNGGPIWRLDKDSQHAIALQLTAAGKKAVAAVAEVGGGKSQVAPRRGVSAEPATATGPSVSHEKAAAAEPPPTSINAPRAGTKIDSVVKMLGRPEGATLEAIVGATGWLSHTTFAALTGLRKRGYALVRSRDEQGGRSVYRLASSDQAGS